MSSSIVITIALIAGIAWLGSILVASLRRRGSEEIPSNLSPGTTDDELETARLETGQKAAVLLSAFLAVSLPIYFLGEQDRQEGFVEQFNEESIDRGAALVEEFLCYDCHGPDGVGGEAPYPEKRSGVTVSWNAPSLNDVFYRYDEEEVNFWVTYGRGNTPMPAWGLDGGGSMNEEQVADVVNFLSTIQIPQMEATAQADPVVAAQLQRLANAEATVEASLVEQRQVLADIDRTEEQAGPLTDIADRARLLLDSASEGIDTDGDGLSDATETGLVALGEELVAFMRVIEPVMLDPENPQSVEGTDDLTTAIDLAAEIGELVDSGRQPALVAQLEAIEAALEAGVMGDDQLSPGAIAQLETIGQQASEFGVEAPGEQLDLESATAFVTALEEEAAAEDATEQLVELAGEARTVLDGGQDPDGDGLSSAAEGTISTQLTAAVGATTNPAVAVANLDPTNEATSGEPDAEVASRVVAGYEGLATNTSVTADNIGGIRAAAAEGIAYLEQALEEQRWAIDLEGVAEAAFDGETETAARAVGLFNGYCARCHTAGFSAGVAYSFETGSGGFGPALWDGRPTVQFGDAADDPDDDLLIQFLINGSQADTPYGLNGFGSGRMPAFGQILPQEDIELIAQYLRGVDLTGMSDEEIGP